MSIEMKHEALKMRLEELGSLAVAFSGGVDSSLLLRVAHDVLGDRVLAVTARSETYPEREYAEAVAFAQDHGIRHAVIVSEELDIEGFAANPVNRCYLCKQELFGKVALIAEQEGLAAVADGNNADDADDYRPGMTAAKELGVISPLREAGFTKKEVRELSRQLGLKNWDKPAFACLSSRFPYGRLITREALRRVDLAEQYLLDQGLRQIRVRDHGELARIEVAPEERRFFYDDRVMDQVDAAFRQFGYLYTALDLRGYRTGSMNEGLSLTKPSGIRI